MSTSASAHRRLAAGVVALSLLAVPHAQVTDVRECVVIYDEKGDAYWRSNVARCAVQLSPASTFKIPHALIALETAVIAADTVQRWDRTAYPNRTSWQADHRLESAIRNSVLWFFQRTAVQIGPARMREFLKQMDYGNTETSGPADRYWINGRLRISADEQVAFLRRFYNGHMPIAKAHVATVQRALVQPPRSVQNSTGIHELIDRWREGTELSAKTGAGMALQDPEERVSWLVGRLTVDGRHYIFASSIVRRGALDPVDAARLAFRTFRVRGLL